MKVKILLFIISFFFAFVSLFSQMKTIDQNFFIRQQDTLLKMAKKLYKLNTDSARIEFNKIYSDKWEEILNNELSIAFNFDSLKSDVGILKSDDQKFRIINWDLPLKDGTHRYYGYIQAKHPKTKKYELYELNDFYQGVKNPETYSSDNSKWYGMLYYQIITCKDYYILLGYDQHEMSINRKLIEPIYFKSDGSPYFGKGVFNNIPKKFPKRIVFEYSTEARVTVSYFADDKKIIFNHVGPPDSFLEGQTQFYVPDGSFDCFEYKKGNWNYLDDCDARNEKTYLDNVKKRKDKEKPVYVPK